MATEDIMVTTNDGQTKTEAATVETQSSKEIENQLKNGWYLQTYR
ncbi:hypothetical protein WN943_015474 [Citrus x changshan-huyou]